MKASEYFGEWSKVIDMTILNKTLSMLQQEYSKHKITPDTGKVFRAFKECKYQNLKVVILGQDPYHQEGVATGLAFGNKYTTRPISPSLEVLMENVLKDVTTPFPIFDITMEEWAKQGVLLLNTSLTVEVGKPGSHALIWRPFIKDFLTKLSEINSGIIYVLFGSNAKNYLPYINSNSNYILEYNHPSYYVKLGIPMECDAWEKINQILKENHNLKIKFYE